MSGPRISLALAAALAVAAVPASATTPNGNGLFPHEADTCTDSNGAPIADTQMLLSGGTSFWMGGVHYAVRSVTYSGGYSGTHTYGVKAGLTGAITCDGNFDDPVVGQYHVHSIDVPIP